jgi:hypothetical protein
MSDSLTPLHGTPVSIAVRPHLHAGEAFVSEDQAEVSGSRRAFRGALLDVAHLFRICAMCRTRLNLCARRHIIRAIFYPPVPMISLKLA